jgi:hypothetical protein
VKSFLILSVLLLATGCSTVVPQSNLQMESMVEQQLAQIPAGVAGKREAFLLVIAGYDQPAVFSNEMKLAAKQLGKAFNAESRTLMLSNSTQDAQSISQVTPFRLQKTIEQFSQKMNADEDLFVVYIVSHGSKDGAALKQSGVPLVLLSPYQLQLALLEAPTPWKAVFISACYSGVFMDTLKTSKSMVMTAADATHPSFGCNFGQKYTYFGNELLNDRDFTAPVDWYSVFQDTDKKVKERERGLHVDYSNPQFWMGPEFSKYLASFNAESIAGSK